MAGWQFLVPTLTVKRFTNRSPTVHYFFIFLSELMSKKRNQNEWMSAAGEKKWANCCEFRALYVLARFECCHSLQNVTSTFKITYFPMPNWIIFRWIDFVEFNWLYYSYDENSIAVMFHELREQIWRVAKWTALSPNTRTPA